MKILFRTGLVLTLLLSLLAPLLASAATVSLAEAALYLPTKTATPGTVQIGADGRVYVVDEYNDILWRINPADSIWEKFSPPGLMGVMVDGSGKIWWTDGADKFGYFDTSQVPYELDYWTVPGDGIGNNVNVGPLVRLGEQVWLATFFSSLFGVYSFTPSSRELCHYAIPGGSYATDLVAQGGRLWWLNWHTGTLMSLAPTGELVGYSLNRNINQRANMLMEGGFLWWADEGLGDRKIARFDPSTGVMDLFDLPSGAQPLRVTALSGGIWYTDAGGSFGRLDMQSEAKMPYTLTAVPYPPLDPRADCKTLPAPTSTPDATVFSGTLSWSGADSEVTQPQAGLAVDIYSMPSGAAPIGIAGLGNSIWLADDGRNKLVRLDLKVEYKLFIPVINR